jgi:hypothetical protein
MLANLSRHKETVFFDVSKLAEISSFLWPSAAASTILARNTSPIGVLRPRDQPANVFRSSSRSSITGAFRMGFILLDRKKPRKPD